MTACVCAHEEIVLNSVVSNGFCFVFKHILQHSPTRSTAFPNERQTPTWSDRTHTNCRASCSSTSGFCTVNCNRSLAWVKKLVRVQVLENLSGLIKQEIEPCCMVLKKFLWQVLNSSSCNCCEWYWRIYLAFFNIHAPHALGSCSCSFPS